MPAPTPIPAPLAVPVIVVQPQDRVVTSGEPATFSVTGSSTAPITYQWKRGGTPIAGATLTTYTLTPTSVSDSGARFSVTLTNSDGSVESASAGLTVNASVVSNPGTAARPFNDQSLWNSRPLSVTYSSYQVPADVYLPTVSEGEFSVGAFPASNGDAPQTITGKDSRGIFIADAEVFQPSITIPHWPANVVPASGSDGHADVIDVASNRIHSFYQLVNNGGGNWTAAQYAWTALNGRGFSTPGQYFQGSRATAVVPIAGLLRTAAINDGQSMYRHAMAMSMPSKALSPQPTYVFPATSADSNAAANNTGQVPEGALMMLPANFDLSMIRNPKLLKIAKTLQTFGAYVVDANYGTPFVIYAELGSGYNLYPNGWDNEVASKLDQIRAAIRQVTTASNRVDANGVPFVPETHLNLLSMRGEWYVTQGGPAGVFDSWEQALFFPDNGIATVQVNATTRSTPSITWAPQVPGKTYELRVTASGNAQLKLDIVRGGGQTSVSTGYQPDGAVVRYVYPADGYQTWVWAASGPAGGGKVTGTLVQVD